MSASEPTIPAGTGGDGSSAPPRPVVRDRVHWQRLALMWVVFMAIAEPLIYFLLWQHLPPGRLTTSAAGDQFDALVLTMIAVGPIGAVLIYFGYALVNWHEPRSERGGPRRDGPPLRSHYRIQLAWVLVTTGIVIGAFVFGTDELIGPHGAGSGEGPQPIWTPAGKTVLPIQVIGQQWYWTYRYPTFGGFETTELMVPANTTIAFHVTSLDVVHDWWAYQLSIKADANPGADNVAFTHTNGKLGRMVVRCDELCGIWHGAMYNFGHVVSKAEFMRWGTQTEKKLAPLTRLLPKFSWTYFPSANGADGGYYSLPFYNFYKYYAGYAGASGNLPPVRVKPSNTPASKGLPSKGSPYVPATG